MNNRIGHLFEPWASVGNLNDVDELFRRMWNSLEGRAVHEGNVSVWQNEQEAIVELDLPGVDLDDVDLSIENSVVSVKATPKKTLEEGVKTRLVERNLNAVERSVQMPFEIQADKAEAMLRNGVLTLRLPRSESQKPKRVSITAG